MALNPAGLSSELKAALDAEFGALTHEGGDAARAAFCDRLANVLVDHLRANAEVSVSVSGSASDGSTVTGTGTGGIQ